MGVAKESTCRDAFCRPQPRGEQSPVPLTPTQRHWWNERMREHGAGERLLHFSARITGELAVESLRESLTGLARRHEALRILVRMQDGILVQDIPASRHFSLAFEVEHLPATDTEQTLRRLTRQFLTRKVDFSVGPLFASMLWRLSPHEHVLIVALEHIITDVASNAILESELWTSYASIVRGEPLAETDPVVQFGDYALWLERTREAWLRCHASYWTERLASAQPAHLPVLPAQRHLPLQEIAFGESLTSEMRALARRQRVLLSLTVLTVYAAAIARWCGQRDLVIRFESHSRNLPELQRMVGFIASGLYLRVEVTDNDSFVSLLERLTLELRLAYEHQDAGRVPDLLPHLPAELSFNWLGKAAPAVQPGARQSAEQRLRIGPFPVNLQLHATRPHFATFVETPSGVVASVHYDPTPAAQSAVERLGRLLRMLASAFAHDPLATIAQIERPVPFPRRP